MCFRLLGLVSSGNVGTHYPSVNLLVTQLCRSVILYEALQANIKDLFALSVLENHSDTQQ